MDDDMGPDHTRDERFQSLFDAHVDAVTRYCLRRLPRDDVADAAAEVFAVAWRRVGHVPGGDDALPWLYGVARNVIRNAQRSTRRRARLEVVVASDLAPHADDPARVVADRSEQAVVLAALGRLRPHDQEVLRLRVFEELSLREIAIALGCSAEAAKKRVARATRRLQAAVAASPAPRAMPVTVEGCTQ
jgi:RNA polymerase sigma-70 factor (ECF subfamily)